MWMLFFLAVFTVAADDRGWAYPLRFQIGPVSFNFFLILLTLAFIVALLRGHHYAACYPTQRDHPMFSAVLALFGIAFAAGIVVLLITNPALLEVREVGFGIRDYMALPLSIFIGYRLIATPQSAKRFAYVLVIAGMAVSIAILTTVGSKAQSVSMMANLNEVRTNAFFGDYAGLACALIVYSIATKTRLFPLWISMAIAVLCCVGQFAPLHRSAWLAWAAGICGMLVVLPRGRRIKNTVVVAISLVVLAGGLWIAMYMATALTRWDFQSKMEQRLISMLPTERRFGEQRAWDTRTGGALMELQLWSGSPLWGRGFGAQEGAWGLAASGIHHNAWTDALAKTGLLGFVPAALVVGGSIVIGRRMVREQVDHGSALIGALGVITGFYYLLYGLSTWSFNSFRGGVCLGLVCGVLLRCRAMQLTAMAGVSETECAPAMIGPDGLQYSTDAGF